MKMVRSFLDRLLYSMRTYYRNLFIRKYMEFTIYMLLCMASSALIAWTMFELWYVTIIVMICGVPLFAFKIKKYMEKRMSKQQSLEFALFLRKLSSCLAAGMTVKNAVAEIVIHNKSEYSVLYSELERMYRLMEYNYSVTQAFAEMAKRCDCSDMKIFSDCISYAIPSGVDLVNLIRYISASMDVKHDTQRDIDQILNLPRYNNRILLCAPVGCIIMIRNIAPDYIAPLYNGSGRIIMVIVAIILLSAAFMGNRISDVKY
ncbi:MAG: hypothetical protein E7385_01735 [Ruminococcaceae bacterium]|nr:hypothetical protein [Oscillospiraceae bacterium]